MNKAGAIGLFDSGYGGLTVLSAIQSLLPQYDYCYLGDNMRAPYGSLSFDTVYEYTKQAVMTLFMRGCNLVILACNTASAKALRTIQQNDLPLIDPQRRVLGVIRPTAEIIGQLTTTRHIGILGTIGTIQSGSYPLEINKLYPDIHIEGEACPMWAPLVEEHRVNSLDTDFYIKENLSNILSRDPQIDTLILGCTHYPLLLKNIKQALPPHISVVSQGEYVARSLQDYLFRHPEMDNLCTKKGEITYLTTGCATKFKETAAFFLDKEIQKVEHILLE